MRRGSLALRKHRASCHRYALRPRLHQRGPPPHDDKAVSTPQQAKGDWCHPFCHAGHAPGKKAKDTLSLWPELGDVLHCEDSTNSPVTGSGASATGSGCGRPHTHGALCLREANDRLGQKTVLAFCGSRLKSPDLMRQAEI